MDLGSIWYEWLGGNENLSWNVWIINMGGDILGIFEFKHSVVFEFGPEEFNIGIAKRGLGRLWFGESRGKRNLISSNHDLCSFSLTTMGHMTLYINSLFVICGIRPVLWSSTARSKRDPYLTFYFIDQACHRKLNQQSLCVIYFTQRKFIWHKNNEVLKFILVYTKLDFK